MTSGREPVFTPEQEAFYRANCRDIPYREQIGLMEEEFGIRLTVSQIKSWRGNHGFSSKVLTGRFGKGHAPFNKGKKGVCAAGCERTWFGKGHVPHNARDPGTRKLHADGYVFEKTDDGRIVQAGRLAYEKLHGPLPAGMCVVHLDGDRSSLSPDNLMAVTRGELAMVNRRGLLCQDPGIARVAIMRARLRLAVNGRERETNDLP